MTHTKLTKDDIFNLIKNHQEYFSFRNLLNITELNFEELSAIVGTLMLEDKIELRINPQTEKAPVFMSRKEQLYAQFLDLLTLYFRQERSVSFYASKLCVSSKHLSFAVKTVCGKTPREIINEKILDEIKYMLCHTQLSIKEITFELNFPNVSFLGKFFKMHCDISPKKFRNKFLGKTDGGIRIYESSTTPQISDLRYS